MGPGIGAGGESREDLCCLVAEGVVSDAADECRVVAESRAEDSEVSACSAESCARWNKIPEEFPDRERWC